jgi:hypothetical protein
MATPTNLPASFVTGAVLTAAQMNDLRGAFRILQIVGATYGVQTSMSSGTPTDTGLSASITPKATTNKVLIIATHSGYNADNGAKQAIRLMRGSTDIAYFNYAGVDGSNLDFNQTMVWLDSPATTSATTYKTQFYRVSGTGTVYAGRSTQQIILCEVSA